MLKLFYQIQFLINNMTPLYLLFIITITYLNTLRILKTQNTRDNKKLWVNLVKKTRIFFFFEIISRFDLYILSQMFFVRKYIHPFILEHFKRKLFVFQCLVLFLKLMLLKHFSCFGQQGKYKSSYISIKFSAIQIVEKMRIIFYAKTN